jgi:signal transduction histidine kinase/CHASE3 domain sensor protein
VESGTGGSDRRVRRAPSVASGVRGTFLVLLGVILLAGIVSLVTLGLVRTERDQGPNRWQPLDRVNGELRESAARAQAAARRYVAAGDPADMAAFEAHREDLRDEINEAFRLADDDRELRESIDRQSEAFEQWVTTIIGPMIERGADPDAALAAATGDDAAVAVERFWLANAATDTLVTERRGGTRERVSELLSLMLVVLVAGMAIGVIAAWYRARQTRRKLTAPLVDLKSTLGRLGSGDLDARATVTGYAEVRDVAESVNALADDNQRLTMRQALRIDQERQGRRLAARLHQHLELDQVLAMAGDAIGESLPADRVVFHLAAEDGYGGAALEWRAPGVEPLGDHASRPLPRSHPLVRAVAEAGTGVLTDVAADPRLADGQRDYFLAIGSRSVLAVPLVADEVTVGLVVAHEMQEPRSWLPGDVDVVQAIADELGPSIRHAQLYDAERGMVERLKDLDEVKSDFVSSVSHELRTPLTSVMGYLEMLRDREAGPLTSEQDRMLYIVERNTERLLDLIEDLLALARIESGRFKVSPAPIELPPLLDDALDAVRPEIGKRELRLLIDVPPGLPLVLGDARQLERVLLNLLSNAVKFTPPGGQVRVTLAPRVRSVVLEVADTGYGIPVEEQGKLFTRFFRSSVSQQHSVPGTGLGLMIVKAVVDSHGGSIEVRSATGRGTAVTVSLPAVPAGRRLEEVGSS